MNCDSALLCCSSRTDWNLIFITWEGKIKGGRMLGFPRFTVIPVDFRKGGGVIDKMADGSL